MVPEGSADHAWAARVSEWRHSACSTPQCFHLLFVKGHGRMCDDILIVGGYGVVGSLVAESIAKLYEGRVILAGRSLGKAEIACRALGWGTRPLAFDMNDVRAIDVGLSGVGTVIVCVAQQQPHLLRAAAIRGLAYTDLSPRLAFWSGVSELEAQAKLSGARILLGTGLSPGISNVMARRLADELGTIERIQTAICLSLGDRYGQDSLRHVFESLERPFMVQEAGQQRRALPFGEPARIAFPEPVGPRTTYRFPWSDVVYYPKTLGAATAVGRFALQPVWLGAAAGCLFKAGALRHLGALGLNSQGSRALHWFKRRYAADDTFALVVDAEAAGRRRRMTLVGRKQALATAASAAEMLRMLVADEITAPGVWFAEQVVPPEPFFAALARSGWHVKRHDLDSHTNSP